MAGYRAWCSRKGLAALDIDALFDEIEKVCERMGFVIETEGEQVYVIGARLKPAAATAATAMVH